MNSIDLSETVPLETAAVAAEAPAVSAPGAHPTLVLALAMGGFAVGTTEFAPMTLLPAFAPALGIDAPTAGHVISAYAVGAAGCLATPTPMPIKAADSA